MTLPRLGPYLAALAALLAFALFALAGIYTFRQQNHVDARLCASAVENRDGLRDTWNAARSLVIQAQTDPERIRKQHEFFDAILSTIPPLVCDGNRPVVRRGDGG